MKRECGCQMESGPFADLFGADLSSCPEHSVIKSLYDHVFFAMAGNVYSMASLAEAGYISGVRPTLNDLNQAGVRLFGLLSPEQRAADLAALGE